MASEIKSGQWINVRVTSQPKAAARIKTMARLFEKDEQVKQERRRLSRSRPIKSHRRGGRMWADRPQRLQAAQIVPGAVYKLFASVDVLRELESISPYVEITPA